MDYEMRIKAVVPQAQPEDEPRVLETRITTFVDDITLHV